MLSSQRSAWIARGHRGQGELPDQGKVVRACEDYQRAAADMTCSSPGDGCQTKWPGACKDCQKGPRGQDVSSSCVGCQARKTWPGACVY